MKNPPSEKLKKIIKDNPRIMTLLKTVRRLELPNWYIAAGAIRNTVWDSLHGFKDTPINDVDVVYFDKEDLSKEKEQEYENKLKKLMPSVNWDVTNQAMVHLWKKEDPVELKSTEEGISRWNETATCLGVRLEKDDSLTFFLPYGEFDLMNLIVKPCPIYYDVELCKKRIKNKKWKEKWPKLEIV